jgi:hypothetical protein
MAVKPGWARKSFRQRSRDRSVWNLNRDEQRTMMITIVGGLGAFLLGGLVIAIAIGLVHLMEAHEEWKAPFAVAYGLTVVGLFVIAGLYTAVVTRKRARSTAGKGRQRTPRLARALLAVVLLLLGLYGLALVGLAAGVK